MLLKLFKMQEQMKREYPEMIELGDESIIGSWHKELTESIESKINSDLDRMFSKFEILNLDLEIIADLLITFNPKFDVSKLADIFMKISEIKATSLELRDTFGPKS